MRSRILFVLAIVMGLITTALFFNYMKKYDQGKVINENTTGIVVAKQAIAANQMLTPGMVELKQVPVKGIYSLTARSLTDVTGKFAETAIAAGEPILTDHLGTSQAESVFVSRKVKQGYRAVSVGVNFVQSASNLIEPGDTVDVIRSITNKQTGKVTSSILLKDVPVLAVGRQMTEPDQHTKYVQYAAVTLELKPQDAVAVVRANQEGTVNLILHTRILPPTSPVSK